MIQPNLRFIINLYGWIRVTSRSCATNPGEFTLLERDLDRFLMEAIGERLSMLGESAKQAIYFDIRRHFTVEGHQVPGKVEVFAEVVEKIFASEVEFLEPLTRQHFYQTAGRSLEWNTAENLAFSGYESSLVAISFGRKLRRHREW